MSLYEIIKSLQTTQGNIAKQAILDANKDSEILKQYMKAVFDPAINYYQSKLPKVRHAGICEFRVQDVEQIIAYLAKRKVTGNAAKEYLEGKLYELNNVGGELLEHIIKRKIAVSNVGETMVLKTWPDLFFIPPYQRCSLMDSKIKEKFSKLDMMYVQPKLDGSFLYLVKEAGSPPEAITRAGSKYPTWFAEKLATGIPDTFVGFVGVGECLVKSHHVYLSRQEGNGILNSVLKDADEKLFEDLTFSIICWDVLTIPEFKAGISTRIYKDRLLWLRRILGEGRPINVLGITNHTVTNLEEAYKIYSDHTARGEEGCVLKNPDSLWKDGTSKDNIKLKIEFEADYVVTGIYEGEGKAKGMMGGIVVETSDGLLNSCCGTGFSDNIRKEMWEQQNNVVGSIVTLKANDVISNRDNAVKSLFLPVFIESRFDKKEADSLERVIEQLQGAKEGKQ